MNVRLTIVWNVYGNNAQTVVPQSASDKQKKAGACAPAQTPRHMEARMFYYHDELFRIGLGDFGILVSTNKLP